MFFKAPRARSKTLRKLRKYFPTWAKMLEYDARQTSDGTDFAAGSWDGERAIVSCGNQSFFIRSPLVTHEPVLWDFAVFGLAAVSMYTNRTIRFDQPVSASAARAVAQLNFNYRLWSLVSLSEPRLELTNIVSDPAQSDQVVGKIICLSGGIDSTATAICARSEAGYTHGLLLAGADYPSADHRGFIELATRVAANAKILGLDFVSVETNFRHMPMDWELQHSFLLAMALHYHSDQFVEGSYALDSSPELELLQHPWGNCAALMNAFSTARFPVKAYGHQLSRGERAEVIANFDQNLLPNISVCWVDNSTGQNCGRCVKCKRTQKLFARLGIATESMFIAPASPVGSESLQMPRGNKIRMTASSMSSFAEALESGSDDRVLLDAHVKKLRRAYVRQMPYR